MNNQKQNKFINNSHLLWKKINTIMCDFSFLKYLNVFEYFKFILVLTFS